MAAWPAPHFWSTEFGGRSVGLGDSAKATRGDRGLDRGGVLTLSLLVECGCKSKELRQKPATDRGRR